MINAGFNVQNDQLCLHATEIYDLAAKIADCANKARNIDFGLDTFGVIGQAFACFLREFSLKQAEHIDELAKLIDEAGRNITATALCYRQTETTNADRLAKLGKVNDGRHFMG